MGDVKLQPLLEAIHPRNLDPSLEPFLGASAVLETSRLQAPTCYWAVYRAGDRRVTLKSFFSQRNYENYVEQLRQHYGDRFEQAAHPRGGLALLPELNAVLWGFPYDPQLPRLYRALDLEWVAELIGRGSAQGLEARLVNYSPEIGAIFAYRTPRQTIAYGKVSSSDDGQVVYDVMDRLWWSTERAMGELRVARPLAYVPDARFLLQRAVSGRVVSPYRNSKLFLDLVKVAGRSLAVIHGSSLSQGRERLPQQELSRLTYSLQELELTAPQLYSTLRLLAGQLQHRIEQANPEPLVPSHGDYKWNQLLHHRGHFSLIDFELFCRAERWFDVGYFCAYLPPASPDDWRDGLATEVLRSAFLESYADAAGVPLRLDRVGLYEAMTLAIRAMTLVWQHQGEWHLHASALLDLAIERLVSPEPKATGFSEPVAVVSLRPVNAPPAVPNALPSR